MTQPSEDPISGALDKAAEETIKVIREWGDKLLGPTLTQVGGLLGDSVAHWRFKNQVKILEKTKEYLEKKGISPKALPPTIVIPLLEMSSLEEEPGMQKRWSQLLSTAISDPVSVTPAFPKILSELSPLEANIIDWMQRRVVSQVGWVSSWEQIRTEFKIDTTSYQIAIGNLVRLNLCRDTPIGDTDSHSSEWESYQRVEFTRLGNAFVYACSSNEQ